MSPLLPLLLGIATAAEGYQPEKLNEIGQETPRIRDSIREALREALDNLPESLVSSMGSATKNGDQKGTSVPLKKSPNADEKPLVIKLLEQKVLPPRKRADPHKGTIHEADGEKTPTKIPDPRREVLWGPLPDPRLYRTISDLGWRERIAAIVRVAKPRPRKNPASRNR